MGGSVQEPFVISVSKNGKTITQELLWDATTYELIQAFYTAAIGVSFVPEDVAETMVRFGNDNLPYNNE